MSSFFKRHSPPNSSTVFDDIFWSWYLESYSLVRDPVGEPLPINPKKYSSISLAVITLQKYFDSLKLPVPSSKQTIALLKSPFTQGDIIKTFHLVRFFQLSREGLFLTNSYTDKLNGTILYKGAENWENVMCYLDALLFSMFAKLESFEPILFISNRAPNTLVSQLAALLRLYISMLRSGNLITTDITIRLCETLSKLGFKEAMSHKQQDSAALFEFLTETLSMPLLTFKIDIKHGGKFNKEDDEKISKERILFVSLPEEETPFPEKPVREETGTVEVVSLNEADVDNSARDSSGAENPVKSLNADNSIAGNVEKVNSDKGVNDKPEKPEENDSKSLQTSDTSVLEFKEFKPASKEEENDEGILLEECLEHYFNNSISVKRELERRATMESLKPAAGEVVFYDNAIPENQEVTTPTSEGNPVVRSNSKREANHEFIENMDETISLQTSGSASRLHKSNPFRYASRTRSSTLSIWSMNDSETGGKSKEVNLPAWMFLRLLPFYTDDNDVTNSQNQSIAKNSKEFVNRRPILPICLKRYSFDATKSSASRSQKRIIIPPFIDLPQFVADDVDDETGNYRLILESAVCHRGHSIASGHFISVIRKNTDNISETEEEAQNSTWYLYDDMKKKSRIVEKTFREIFNKEWPYLLFYRLVTTDEIASSTNSSKANLAQQSSSNPFIAPAGSKNSYWSDDSDTPSGVPSSGLPLPPPALSPILSASNSDAPPFAVEEYVPLKKVDSAHSSTSSIPIPDISPTDARFVDIRNKYYWYMIDKNKNYIKELPSIKTSSGRDASVSFNPQFRRNSQWSERSNVSSIDTPSHLDLLDGQINAKSNASSTIKVFDTNGSDEKLGRLPNSTSSSSLLKRTTRYLTSPVSSASRVDSALSLEKSVSPINLGTATQSIQPNDVIEENHKHHHLHQHRGHSEPKKSSLLHRKSKKRDDYKREKCVIT
ncbi:hypothetical protein G9P44_001206 [Scheffersomyces stipitis]|nr:hypothetical protein G9P44_001206 [Scheffersomyces stipitis]